MQLAALNRSPDDQPECSYVKNHGILNRSSPDRFSPNRGNCPLTAPRSGSSFLLSALKCFSVCLVAALFALTGVAQTQAQTLSCPHTSSDPPTDKDVLITLYCYTNGGGWKTKTKWLSNKNINQWWGVTTFNSRVTKLYLNNNKLTGTMPTELGNLTRLKELRLERNDLSGTIPAELGELTKLEDLALNENNLNGIIPTELGKLIKLEKLRLDINNLSGTIPAELGELAELEQLVFYVNNLSGTIPPELGRLTNLVWFYLNTNNLSGTIPPELGTLTKVKNFALNKNNLSGTIPTELGKLTDLRELFLNDNQLSGTIPPELGRLTNLRYLLLSENKLTGTIPAELQTLTNLKQLILRVNQLSGTIPPELGKLIKLERLYLYENQLSGSGIELEDMDKLERLFIQNTMITPGDAMIDDMEILATMEGGSLKGSGLWGSDDLTDVAKQTNSDLGRTIDWAALWAIYVDNDGAEWKNNSGWLAGSSFSNWYGVETNSDGRVEILNLRYNDLKEDIPNALEALKDITRLDLSYNGMLTGELSPRLMDISSLTELNIRCTGIDTPDDMDFQSWLQTITFIDTQPDDACSAPPAVPVRMMTVTPQVGGLSVSWEESTDADGYKVQWKSGGQQFNATSRQHTVTGGSTTSYTITGLTAGTEYTVRVIATKSVGDKGFARVEAREIPRFPAPGRVTGVGVTPQVGGLSVSWEESTDADGYKVQWKSGGQQFNETSRQHPVAGRSTVSYVITGLAGSTEYTVRVIATRSNADDGQPSQEDSATPITPPPLITPPSPPSLGQVTGISVTPQVGGLSVSWNKVTNADGYKVQWKSGGQQFNATDRQRTVTGGSTTSYTITGLTAGTEYTVRVIATKSVGDDGQLPLEAKGIPELPDQVVPGDSPAGETGGGCAMISQETADNMSAKTFLNLLFVVSFMFLPFRKANLFIFIGIGTISIFNRT